MTVFNKFFSISMLILGAGFSSFASLPREDKEKEFNFPFIKIVDHEKIKLSLLKSPVKKEIKTIKKRGQTYPVVKLEDGTLAIFKERKHTNFSGIFSEILSYKLSYNILGLDHTVPPIIPTIYKGSKGVLQFYIESNLNLVDHLEECIQKANHDSYDNLQIFLFSASMGDLNNEGIIPWYQEGKINFSYVDSEMAFAIEQVYGKCMPELTTTLSQHEALNKKYIFTSKYTSSFPTKTIERMKFVTPVMLEYFWKNTLTEIETILGIKPTISLEDKDIYLKGILKDINSIIKAATVSKNQ